MNEECKRKVLQVCDELLVFFEHYYFLVLMKEITNTKIHSSTSTDPEDTIRMNKKLDNLDEKLEYIYNEDGYYGILSKAIGPCEKNYLEYLLLTTFPTDRKHINIKFNHILTIKSQMNTELGIKESKFKKSLKLKESKSKKSLKLKESKSKKSLKLKKSKSKVKKTK